MSQLSNNDTTLNDAASDAPQLCRNCCEFFGFKHTDFLCSKCFKESAKPKEDVAAALAKALPEQAIHLPDTAANSQDASRKTSAFEEEEKTEVVEVVEVKELKEVVVAQPEKPKQVNKCFTCSKKVSVLGFKCKCDNTFCRAHRLPEDHDCDYNFKQDGIAKLLKDNPLIQAAKIDKI